MKTVNAKIESVEISISDYGCLTAWVHLNYGDSGQGFGGYYLYSLKKGLEGKDLGSHFLARCMQVAGVDKWDEMSGKAVRVRAEHNKVHAIGHLLEDDWFYPAEDYKPYSDKQPND